MGARVRRQDARSTTLSCKRITPQHAPREKGLSEFGAGRIIDTIGATAVKKILLVWELGGDLGHLARLATWARELVAAGFAVSVALRDLSRSHLFFDELDVALLQAPVWLPKITMQRPIACLPDTLLLSGYLDAAALHSLARAWQALIASAAPDLIICDYAPTALLASRELLTARGRPLARIICGTGFANPVPGHAIADWRPQPGADDLIARQEALVLRTVNQVLQRQHKTPLRQLADLFEADVTFITTFPELDLYREQRANSAAATTYCIAETSAPARRAPEWPPGPGPRIAAYLKPQHPRLPLLLRALADCAAKVLVACPGGDAKLLQGFASEHLQVSTEVIELERAIEQADLFVGHGNMGSVTQSLYAGRPVLALPIMLEQLLLGNRLQAEGLGRIIVKVDDAAALTAQIGQMLSDGDCSDRVRAFAQRYTSIRHKPTEQLVIEKCDALLGVTRA